MVCDGAYREILVLQDGGQRVVPVCELDHEVVVPRREVGRGRRGRVDDEGPGDAVGGLGLVWEESSWTELHKDQETLTVWFVTLVLWSGKQDTNRGKTYAH